MSSTKSKTALRRERVAENIFRRGDVFYLIAGIQGRQICERLDASNLTEAKQERDRRMAELRPMRTSEFDQVSRRSVTFDTLASEWIAFERGPSGSRKPSTIALRELLLKNHVSPVLGSMRVVKIEAPHVRKLIDALRKKGQSGSSVRGIVASVSCVLDFAARQGIVPRNVCQDLTREDKPKAKRETEPRYLTEEQVQSLFKALGDEFRPIAQVCYYAGLRISEVLALTWDDIDLERSLIFVRDGKTKASAAPVSPLPELLEILKAHRKRSLSLGQHGRSRLVFQTATGQPQNRRNALRAVNTASTKAKLDVEQVVNGETVTVKVGCHDLRHSLAALAYKRGLMDVEVARLLRHSTPAVTNAIYAGMSGTAEEQAHAVMAKMTRQV